MPNIRVNGVDLAYEQAGAGPTIVFSHAGIADRRMWEHQFQQLAADYRVIRFDWRGYGQSGDAAGSFAHHQDLLSLLDALDIQQTALVGSSMGGTHSLDVALLTPQRVSALVLICAGLSGHEWPAAMGEYARELVHRSVAEDRLEAYRLHRGEPVREHDVAAMAQAYGRFMIAGPERDPAEVDPQVWQTALTMMQDVFRREWSGPPSTELALDPPAVGRLAEVQMPVLVVNGLCDAPWIQDVADILTSGIPGAQRIDLADAGHLPPIERPQEITAALRRFLGHDRRTTSTPTAPQRSRPTDQ
jgi:pimeloyl-ACP methyl ester carboxylesterase